MSYVEQPAWKVADARRMFAQGMGRVEIALKLGVAESTVYVWVHPDSYERILERKRQRYRHRRDDWPSRKFGWETFERVVALWERGDSYTAISNALAVYEQIDVCTETLRSVLREHHPDWTTRPRGAAFGSANGNRRRVPA